MESITSEGVKYIPLTEMWLEYFKNRKELDEDERHLFLESTRFLIKPLIRYGYTKEN